MYLNISYLTAQVHLTEKKQSKANVKEPGLVEFQSVNCSISKSNAEEKELGLEEFQSVKG